MNGEVVCPPDHDDATVSDETVSGVLAGFETGYSGGGLMEYNFGNVGLIGIGIDESDWIMNDSSEAVHDAPPHPVIQSRCLL